MGIETSSLLFLLSSRKAGVSFAKTITLGRQDLLLRPAGLRGLLARFGLDQGEEDVERILNDDNMFADRLFKRLGAQVIDSMDYSSFEGATIVHDLNQSLPEPLKRTYSVVFDGGTLEHVFNFPQAIANCMEMVAVGGHFLAVTPCNNMMGHGFYQFSPELFFRVFSESNGFAVEAMYINEGWGQGPWFQVTDPDAIRRRVGRATGAATNLYVRARRLREVPLFATAPYQSDYSSIWKEPGSRAEAAHRLDFFLKQPAPKRGILNIVGKLLPRSIRENLRMYKLYRQIMRDCDPEAFRAIEPD